MHSKYRKMLNRMQEKQDRPGATPTPAEEWFLYILQCKDGSLYTGVTKNLDRRFKMHSDGKASRYTRSRRPVRMLYHETCSNRTQALIRECAIKSLPREKKEQIIAACKKN